MVILVHLRSLFREEAHGSQIVMRLRQLEYFLAICKTHSFTAAAELLYVAQPSLSQQVRLLEKELGCDLFERSSQGVFLTPAGRVLLPEAKATLGAAEKALRSVRSFNEGVGGDLHVLTIRSVGAGVVPQSITAWRSNFPDVIVHIKDFYHRKSLEFALRDGVGDLAIGPRPDRVDGIVLRSLGYEELLIVSTQDHRDDNTLDPACLQERDWILYEPEHGLSEVVDSICASHGISPRPVAHTWQVEAAIVLAMEGLGIALLPENVIPDECTPYSYRIGPGVFRELTAYCRNAVSESSSKYLALLVEANLPLLSSDQLPKDGLAL